MTSLKLFTVQRLNVGLIWLYLRHQWLNVGPQAFSIYPFLLAGLTFPKEGKRGENRAACVQIYELLLHKNECYIGDTLQ